MIELLVIAALLGLAALVVEVIEANRRIQHHIDSLPSSREQHHEQPIP